MADVIVPDGQDQQQKPSEKKGEQKRDANVSVEIVFVADRSGSMEGVRDDAIGGFNSLLESQRELGGKATMTYVQFDNRYEVVFADRPLDTVAPLTRATFVPRGATALLDAVGRTINSVDERIAKLPQDQRPDVVVFVVLTDGYENASTEFTYDTVKALIEAKTKDGWDFTFLSADIDAAKTGGQMGFAQGSIAQYEGSAQGTRAAARSVSHKTRDIRFGASVGTSMQYLAQAQKEIKHEVENKADTKSED